MNELIRDWSTRYHPVSLEELDQVRLMDRVETKFVLNLNRLPQVLQEMESGYRILDTAATRIHTYKTVYFDTPALKLYQLHHQGKLNRYKIRFRKYCNSELSFFEIKFKNNRGRTIKKRILQRNCETIIDGKAKALIKVRTPFDPDSLAPVLEIRYDRMTFVNRDFTERITLDTGLTFRKGSEEYAIPDLCIAEVKQERSEPAGFPCLMHRIHVQPLSVSKFCLGIIHLYPEIRKNNFKPKLLYIQKILKNVN